MRRQESRSSRGLGAWRRVAGRHGSHQPPAPGARPRVEPV